MLQTDYSTSLLHPLEININSTYVPTPAVPLPGHCDRTVTGSDPNTPPVAALPWKRGAISNLPQIVKPISLFRKSTSMEKMQLDPEKHSLTLQVKMELQRSKNDDFFSDSKARHGDNWLCSSLHLHLKQSCIHRASMQGQSKLPTFISCAWM